RSAPTAPRHHPASCPGENCAADASRTPPPNSSPTHRIPASIRRIGALLAGRDRDAACLLRLPRALAGRNSPTHHLHTPTRGAIRAGRQHTQGVGAMVEDERAVVFVS